jgi:hypothetical protein
MKLFSEGGTHALSNLVVLCQLCRARHKRHYAEHRFMPRSPISVSSSSSYGSIALRAYAA